MYSLVITNEASTGHLAQWHVANIFKNGFPAQMTPFPDFSRESIYLLSHVTKLLSHNKWRGSKHVFYPNTFYWNISSEVYLFMGKHSDNVNKNKHLVRKLREQSLSPGSQNKHKPRPPPHHPLVPHCVPLNRTFYEPLE